MATFSAGMEDRDASVCRELSECKTAMAVVRTTRTLLDRSWHISWGSLALLLIAQKSTPKTRKEWMRDAMVKRLAALLEEELSVWGKAARLEATTKVEAFGERAVEECLAMLSARLDAELVALEALRRMSFQGMEAQREKLLEMEEELGFLGWERSAERTVRYLWLSSPLEPPGPAVLPAIVALRTAQRELKPDVVPILCTSLAQRSELKRPTAVAIQDLDVTFSLMDLLKERRKGFAVESEGFCLTFDLMVQTGVSPKQPTPLPLLTLSERPGDGSGAAPWRELFTLLMLPGGTELMLAPGPLGEEGAAGLSWEPVAEPPPKKAKKGEAKKPESEDPPPPRVLQIKKMLRLRLEVSTEGIVVFVDGLEALSAAFPKSENAAKVGSGSGSGSEACEAQTATLLPEIRLWNCAEGKGDAGAQAEAATEGERKGEGECEGEGEGGGGGGGESTAAAKRPAEASATAVASEESIGDLAEVEKTLATSSSISTAAPTIQGSISNITCRLPGRSAICDPQLVARMIQHLRRESFYTRILCSDVVDLADALVTLDIREEGVWRSLGQSILQRKAELTPNELWRLKVGLQFAGLTQQTVWAALGFERSNRKGNVITTQAFRSHRGHAKAAEEAADVEEVSPCREVEEYPLR